MQLQKWMKLKKNIKQYLSDYMKIIILCIVLILFTTPVYSLTPSQHISIATILANEADTNFEAFVYGFVSHAVTDQISPQHYNFDLFNPSANYDIIALEGILSLYQIYKADEKERYAIAGALAPDIIDGSLVLIDRSRYYEGNHLFPFHEADISRTLSKKSTIILSVSLVAIQF